MFCGSFYIFSGKFIRTKLAHILNVLVVGLKSFGDVNHSQRGKIPTWQVFWTSMVGLLIGSICGIFAYI